MQNLTESQNLANSGNTNECGNIQQSHIKDFFQLLLNISDKYENLAKLLRQELDENSIGDIFNVIQRLPRIAVDVKIKAPDGETIQVKKCEANRNISTSSLHKTL